MGLSNGGDGTNGFWDQIERMGFYTPVNSNIICPDKWLPNKKIQTQNRPQAGKPTFTYAFHHSSGATVKIAKNGRKWVDADTNPEQNGKNKNKPICCCCCYFVNPIKEEVERIREIFDAFGRVSGLKINIDKSYAYPIQCDNMDLDDILQSLPYQVKTFPCQYLGLPLSLRK